MGENGKQFAQDAADVLNQRIDDLIRRVEGMGIGCKARLPLRSGLHQTFEGEWHATAASVEFDVKDSGMMRVGFPSIAGRNPYVELHFDLSDVSNDTIHRLVCVMRGA